MLPVEQDEGVQCVVHQGLTPAVIEHEPAQEVVDPAIKRSFGNHGVEVDRGRRLFFLVILSTFHCLHCDVNS